VSGLQPGHYSSLATTKCERVILVSIVFNVIELIGGGMVNLGFLNTSHCSIIKIVSRRFITSTMINYKVKNSCFYVMISCLRQRRFKCNIEGRSRNQYYLLTPWCTVLEKLTGLQLVKKFPAFHGTRRFITALTSVRHLTLS